MRSERAGYGGMTVNKRIVMSGLIGTWDRAIADGDRVAATEVLRHVDLGNQAADIVETALARRPE